MILSLLVVPLTHGDPAFRNVVKALLHELEESAEVARPVPDNAPGVGWPPPGVELEARASRRRGESHFIDGAAGGYALAAQRLRVAA